MDYATLGRTGLRVSVAGLGCGGFSRLGLSTGKSETDAIAIIRQAVELGVNFLIPRRPTAPRRCSARRSNRSRARRS
jgi:predicted aldo/keto reductase-like oxidoreductase